MEPIWHKNYPQGVSTTINPDQYSSIIDLVDQSCDTFADNIAFTCLGADLSFKDLKLQSEQFAAFLQSKGLKKGDRIAIQMPNLLQFPIAMFGALKAGLVVVNTNPLYTQHEMEHQFKDSGAKAIVILANFAEKLEKVMQNTAIETVVITEIGDRLSFPKGWIVNKVIKHLKKMVPSFHLPQAIPFNQALKIGEQNSFEAVRTESSELAFLQYTGGTTGVSKGAMLTHRNILSNMLMIHQWMKPVLKDGEEVAVTALPLYHIFSLTVNCLSFLKMGGTNLLITNPKDIPGFIKILKAHPFTVFTGVNTLYNALAIHPDFKSIDFSKLKISVAGGMALQQAVSEKWMSLTQSPVAEGFGLTETSPVVTCNPLDGNEKVGSIGLPLPSTEIKLIDDNNQEVPMGERGELCVKGPQVMKGYWQREDETDNVMLPDGWLKTGDVAIMEEDGFAKIVDRKKDMILVSGFNVYPNEIEDALAKHPDVIEVAAIGVPDERSGEAVKVFVVTQNKNLCEKDVIEFSKTDLVAYKRPKLVEFRQDLPKTNVGKILRRALKEGAN